jgi:NitT/TauT family transport system ATP-binding protein
VDKIIEYKNLQKYYQVRKAKDLIHALDGITFDVKKNEFTCIVGPSGCGKSTLMKITAGLLPYDEGQVIVDGKPVDGPIKNVGMVFQQPVLLEWRSIIGNVLLPIEILGLDEKKHQKIAIDLIKLVGLEGFEKRYPYELSGGMQQRVSICRALVHDPTILLMDEPFGALDAMTRDKMNLELLRIWKKAKKTIIYITHHIPEAVFLADKVIVLCSRPSNVKKIVEIDLPRPRTIEMQYTKEFRNYCRSILQLIDATNYGETHSLTSHTESHPET